MTEPTKEHEVYVEELLEAILVTQRRSATFLAILTYITVISVALGILGGVIGVVLANQM